MAVITRSLIAEQLVPGLDAVIDQNYESVDPEHKMLFEVRNSNRSFEEHVQMGSLGYAASKAEGDSIRFDNMKELGKARYVHDTIALGFIVTQEAIEDNLYETAAMIRAQALGRSMAETKEQRAANYFNRAFTATGFGLDEQPLFTASHPTSDVGNQSNLLSGDLSETTLETALININRQQNDRGFLTGARGQKLIIPTSLMFVAQRILKSDLSTTVTTAGATGVTNVNDINAMRSMGVFPEGVGVCHRLTDNDAWFIKTNIPNSTIMFQRVALERGEDGDFDTGNFKYKARERYSFGHTDWRGWYASPGA